MATATQRVEIDLVETVQVQRAAYKHLFLQLMFQDSLDEEYLMKPQLPLPSC